MDLALLCTACNYSHQLQTWLEKDCSLYFVFIGFYKFPLCILLINIYHINYTTDAFVSHLCMLLVPLETQWTESPTNTMSNLFNEVAQYFLEYQVWALSGAREISWSRLSVLAVHWNPMRRLNTKCPGPTCRDSDVIGQVESRNQYFKITPRWFSSE